MATETYAGLLGEVRKAHATAGGDASSTTPAVIQFPPGTQFTSIEGRNYTTAVVVQVAMCPYLRIFKTADALATITDQSETLQDASTATTATYNSFDVAANNNFIYLGSHIPFRGVLVDIVNTNSVASVLSVDYWNGAWTGVSGLTDGTASVGVTFAVDGSITWTLPTDWAAVGLATAVATTGAGVRDRATSLYWARFKVSVQFDSTVSAASMVALSRSTNYYELVTGRVREQMVNRSPEGYVAVEHRTDAGTASVLVNIASVARTGFAS